MTLSFLWRMLVRCKLIKEIESTNEDLFDYNLIIDEKTYRVCAGSPKEGILAVEEIQLNREPESDVRCDDGLECPYCGGVDYDGHYLVKMRGLLIAVIVVLTLSM